MKKRILLAAFLSSAISFGQVNAPIYRTSLGSGLIIKADPITLEEIESNTLNSSTGEVEGVNGVAIQPCSGTPFVLYKVEGIRYLGTLDIATSFITEISMFGDNFATICFGSDYDELYGVTGNGATTSETLYAIDITTGGVTVLATLSSESDGEALSFSPETGKLYRWSGWGYPDCIMQEIDPTTFIATNIPLTGFAFENIGGATYIGDNQFIVADVSNQNIFQIGTDGLAVEEIISFDAEEKALFQELRYIEASNNVICNGESVTISATNADGYEWFLDDVSTGVLTETYNATDGGSYYCMLTIDTCTYASNSVEISEVSVPDAEIGTEAGTIICVGDSLLITATEGADTYEWYVDGVLIAGVDDDFIYATVEGDYTVVTGYAGGCSDSTETATVLTITACDVSINEEEGTLFTIYPNPTAGIMNIGISDKVLNENLQVDVLSLDGKTLEHLTINNNQIDLSHLNNGSYIIRIVTDNKTYTKLILKE